MITYRNIYKRIILLVLVMVVGVSNADCQTLTDYAKQYKAEKAEKQRIEKEAYEAACTNGTINAFKSFVNDYPNSKYASEAKSKIRSLELKTEKDAYSSACKKGTIEAFRGFLKKYPQSQYAQDVRNRINDFDLWNTAKKRNTIQAYNSYLQNSKFKTYASEARAAIQNLNAVSAWQKVKSTNNLSEVQAYIKDYPYAPCIADAKKREHELKGVQYYKNGNLANAYNEFNEAGGKYALAFENRIAYEKCEEYHTFSSLSTNSQESELLAFLSNYPGSKYSDQVSNMIAVAKAKNFSTYTDDNTYKIALSYAKDEVTRGQVRGYYKMKQREYAQYKKEQRRIKRKRDGGIINFGIELADISLSPNSFNFDDYDIDNDNDVDYFMNYNVGLSIKLGNYKSPIQLEIGAKPGLAFYDMGYDSENDIKTSFHLQLYARFKIGIGGSDNSQCYFDGIGYYNAIKDSYIENDYSASVGLGVSWRHWDWRIIYYKQDVGKNTKQGIYDDNPFLGTSFIYYF